MGSNRETVDCYVLQLRRGYGHRVLNNALNQDRNGMIHDPGELPRCSSSCRSFNHNACYIKGDDLDAYDFDCDELNISKVALMVNYLSMVQMLLLSPQRQFIYWTLDIQLSQGLIHMGISQVNLRSVFDEDTGWISILSSRETKSITLNVSGQYHNDIA
ncbi:hypothetical protein Tco_0604133 [Tanacetum coccineum]